VAFGRGPQPLELGDVRPRPRVVCRVHELLDPCGWHCGIDDFKDLRLDSGERVAGPVLQAPRAGNQDAACEQPVAGGLHQVVGVGCLLCMNVQCAGQVGLVSGSQVAKPEVGLRPELVLVEGLPALVDGAQAGNRRRRNTERLGGMPQQVARQHVETIQRPASDAHEHDHQRGWQAMVAAELFPDRFDVGRSQFEELLAIEFAQARRQAFPADEAQGERGHGG
jgi:hypothetical protein